MLVRSDEVASPLVAQPASTRLRARDALRFSKFTSMAHEPWVLLRKQYIFDLVDRESAGLVAVESVGAKRCE